MADDFVQVATDGSGKKIQTFLNTVGANAVEAEGVVLVTSAGAPYSPALDATLTGGTARSKVTDGTNNAAVRAASSAATFAADPALVVDIRPGGILPAAAANGDGLANPTTTQLSAGNYLYNEATWDRQRGNINTSTGDTGTKTTSFTGTAQLNYNARGAFLTVLLGTVSGTTPTMSVQLQWSPDGGTTWLNIGAALANLTASNQTGTIVIYPTNLSVAGATPAALTLGSTVSLLLNAPLPRRWRLNFTIGGTTPSFALSSVQVNYIL